MSQVTNAHPMARSVAGGRPADKESAPIPAFRSLPFLSNSRAQTLVAMFWPGGRESFPSIHRVVEMPDGDKLVVVVSTPPEWRPDPAGGRTS